MNYDDDAVDQLSPEYYDRPRQPRWESAVVLEPKPKKMIRPEPSPLPSSDAWRDTLLTLRDIVVGIIMACGLPAVIVIIILLFAGCDERKPAAPEDCYDRALSVRRSCMQGVDEQGAVAECTEQMNATYTLCERAREDKRHAPTLPTEPNERHAPPVAPSMLEAP